MKNISAYLRHYFRLLGLILIPFLVSCEKNLLLEIPEGEAQLIVEGHIEQDTPPVVVLTRSVPVFSNFSPQQIEAAFVHGARIFVSDGAREYALQEYNTNNLPPELQKLVAEQFGFSPDNNGGKLPFTFYFYTSPELKGQVGKNYKLRIETDKETATASTSIPQLNPIDSLWIKPHPNPKMDSLVALWYRYKDPDTVGNCVRYFTKRNQEPFYPGFFNSVFIDDFVNGKPFIDFPLQRGEPKTKEPDFDSYSYFRKGDTITIKWAAIDMAHYRFWQSLESDFGSRGNPFGAPVKIESNIKGGLGIWGGYGVLYYRFIVPN
ncbi:DUF4249 domain-containing protein [Adhaeribacter sp. BT258]|uniref:DUF4249 domain-containing protein n=1 Tax=Adhaeribacter terrigena TaxID=2793070 RepID=A0ABS1C0I0_9BACT|nr:DUF4249 domain-containing protein [Adhaeribacter terrigena]MBK0402927.1 DUF4249 domain-containing protein [Adhaeribacter terrigena]